MQVRQLQRHGGRQLNQNDDGKRKLEREREKEYESAKGEE